MSRLFVIQIVFNVVMLISIIVLAWPSRKRAEQNAAPARQARRTRPQPHLEGLLEQAESRQLRVERQLRDRLRDFETDRSPRSGTARVR